MGGWEEEDIDCCGEHCSSPVDGDGWVGGWVGGCEVHYGWDSPINQTTHPPTHPPIAYSSSFEPPSLPLLTHPIHPPTYLPSHKEENSIEPEERGQLHYGWDSPINHSWVAVRPCGGDETVFLFWGWVGG